MDFEGGERNWKRFFFLFPILEVRYEEREREILDF